MVHARRFLVITIALYTVAHSTLLLSWVLTLLCFFRRRNGRRKPLRRGRRKGRRGGLTTTSHIFNEVQKTFAISDDTNQNQIDYTYAELGFSSDIIGRTHKIKKMLVTITPNSYDNRPLSWQVSYPGDYSGFSGRINSPMKTVRATGSSSISISPRRIHDWSNVAALDVLISVFGKVDAGALDIAQSWTLLVKVWYSAGREFGGTPTQAMSANVAKTIKQIVNDELSTRKDAPTGDTCYMISQQDGSNVTTTPTLLTPVTT